MSRGENSPAENAASLAAASRWSPETEGALGPDSRWASRFAFSMADQNFALTRSPGIFKLSTGLAECLAARPEARPFTLLGNSSLAGCLRLPKTASFRIYDQPLANRIQRILWDQGGVYRAARRCGSEWLVLPKGFASFLQRCPMKLATYVHDTMHEFYRTRYPGVMSRAEMFYFQRSLLASICRSRVIFTNSEFTRSELLRLAQAHNLTPPEIIAVGIGFNLPAKGEPSRRNRLLVFASPWRHKRTDLALAYLAKWHEETQFDGTIEWIGNLPRNLSLPERPGWILHSRMTEGQFSRVLAGSRAALYFTEFEGFGMPPVEAVLAGACPVYSSIPATTEVMQGTGCRFENSSYESFRQALNQALAVTADTLSDWAGQLSRRHNWESVAERCIAGILRADSVTGRTA